MTVLTQPTLPSSVLAIVTTLHLALASLRNHRSSPQRAISASALISLLFTAVPWVLPSALGVVVGLLAHGVWFGACELLAAAPVATEDAGARAKSRAVAAPRSGASVARPAAGAGARPAPAPAGFVAAPIVAVFDETPEIKTIRLTRPDGFQFEAGQFLTVRVRADGHEFARCYSISSAPESPGYLEISVKRQGVVSNALHATARPGATLSVKRPNGKFKYPSNDDRPIVLIAGGVGVTPLMSMLRHAVHAEPTRPVTLLYAAPTIRDFAFRDELAGIARRHPQARVFLAATREAAPPQHVYPGRIDAALLRATVPAAAHSIAFLCGPEPMIAATKTLLVDLGLPTAQIRHEVFQAAIAASAAPDRAEDGARQQAAGAAAAAARNMHCTVSNRTVPVRPGQTLLEAAEEHGVEVESLCRSGVCGTCRTRVVSGDVACDSTTLDPADATEGFVLACVATPRSACTVEL
jgi:ferredoxin-NADP reductase